MKRLLIGLLFALSAAHAPAEGPGTRIGSSPQIPRAPQTSPQAKEDACARLREEQDRRRCLEKARRPVETGDATGPGSVAGSSGAGAGASSGTTGAGSFGAGAPR